MMCAAIFKSLCGAVKRHPVLRYRADFSKISVLLVCCAHTLYDSARDVRDVVLVHGFS